MNNEILIGVVKHVVDDMRDVFREDISRGIAEEMTRYRMGYIARDSWCCRTMETFALKHYGVNSPRGEESVYSTQFLLHGEPLHYCPFCGVKL